MEAGGPSPAPGEGAAAAAGLGGDETLTYSRVAMWLHWLIAALIVANLLLGFFHEDFAKPTRTAMMFWHKSIGLTVLALTLLRLGWRLGHAPPPFDPLLKRWEAGLARAVHALFYLLLLVIPLSGWLIVSSGSKVNPTDVFGLFRIGPLPVTPGEGLHELAEQAHELLGYTMLALLVLHVAGALKHHFDGHRHLIGRMAPWLYRSARPGRPEPLETN